MEDFRIVLLRKTEWGALNVWACFAFSMSIGGSFEASYIR